MTETADGVLRSLKSAEWRLRSPPVVSLATNVMKVDETYLSLPVIRRSRLTSLSLNSEGGGAYNDSVIDASLARIDESIVNDESS